MHLYFLDFLGYTITMNNRPISGEQRRWLLREIQHWRDVGIVTDEATERIIGLYESEAVAEGRQSSRTVSILMGIAGLFAAAAVCLLIAYNWSALSGAAKIGIVVGITASVYATAFRSHWRKLRQTGESTGRFSLSEALFFLGCLLLGGDIFLIQQVFQNNGQESIGVLLWLLGIVPFVLYFDSVLFHALFVSLLAIWILSTAPDSAFGRDSDPFALLRIGLVTFPALTYGIWRSHVRQSPALLGMFLLLGVFATELYIGESARWLSVPLFGMVGAGLVCLDICFTLPSSIASAYRRYGLLMIVFFLALTELQLSLSDSGFRLDPGSGGIPSFWIIATIGVTFIASLSLSIGRILRSAAGSGENVAESALMTLLTLMFAAQALWIILSPQWDRFYFALGTDIVTLISAASLISIGLQQDRGRTSALGVIALLLQVTRLYIQFIGSAGGILGGAALFLLCAIVVFMVANYWRRKKSLTH